MAQNDLPPVPHTAPMTDEAGMAASVWSDWFRKISPVSERTDTGGYVKLPGGMIVQWGFVSSINNGTSGTVTFPTAFPTACLQAWASVRNNSGTTTAATGHWGTGTYTAADFQIHNRTSQIYSFNWIAIGH
jgi:hypothetical protein